jgi:hypothetical protein
MRPSPPIVRLLLLALSAVFLIGLFSPEAADTDFWWHLKTGQSLVELHTLPVPDPFAYTTANAKPAYEGELVTRHFNLTHEWLAEVLLYLSYRMGGFPGVVLLRAFVLTTVCGLVGLVAWIRTRGFFRSLGAALASASVLAAFAQDRPFIYSFLLLGCLLAILESRRWLWLLPPLMVFWSNLHGGFILAWFVLGAYAAEALVYKPRDNRIPIYAALAIVSSGLNPNGFGVLRVLLYYRQSFLTSTLQEWARPSLWPPRAFLMLLVAAVVLLLWERSRVRPADWILLAGFTAAALTAERNIVLIGILAPVVIAAYVPWRQAPPRGAEFAAAAVLIAVGIARGSFFQLRAADWKYPSGAADFLLSQRIAAPLFNSYEYGGYLIWRLWPAQKVFIDGRALSEQVFQDYVRILYNHDESGGKSAAQLLDQYGVEVIVMNGFEYISGTLYKLLPSMANPAQPWQLVYSDAQAVVFMRHPPPGIEPLDRRLVFDHLEAECGLHIDRDPAHPRCARSLAQAFTQIGDLARARGWLGTYLSHPHNPDPEADQAYQQLLSQGR